MKNLTILVLIFLLSSCSNKNNEGNIGEVISFMIDGKAFPLPPPPKMNDTTMFISEKIKDSILNLRLKIALYPKLEDILGSKNLKDIPDEYKRIIATQGSSSNRLSLDEVFSKKEHQIIMADTIELKKSKDFNEFDLLFRFSRFYYSEDGQKILFELGISRSKLAGHSIFYALKKQNDKWEVEYSKPLSIW